MIEHVTTCEPRGLERTRYFPRQLVGAADLTQDQTYFREKQRRHNRYLHGWGVVCGARVKRGDQPCEAVVESGYVLGPYGDEILIERDTVVDLCSEDIDGNAILDGGESDPWCSSVRVDRLPGEKVYLAVRYVECQTKPVRILHDACGCEPQDCEYSRTKDSFAFKILIRLPDGYSDPMPHPDSNDVIRCGHGEGCGRACLECAHDGWVILADLTLGTGGELRDIDCCSHRRNVASFGSFYFVCEEKSDYRGLEIAANLGRALGRPVLADLSVADARQPLMTVPVRSTRGNLLSLPVYFEVEPGETIGEIIAREGDRRFFDPSSGQPILLREMYEAARVNPADPVSSLEDAVRPLEALSLELVDNVRVLRSAIEETLSEEGRNRLEEAGGGLDSALTLPVTDLASGEESPIAAAAERLSVERVAGMSRDEFVERALRRVPAARQPNAERTAIALHERASRISRLTRSMDQ